MLLLLNGKTETDVFPLKMEDSRPQPHKPIHRYRRIKMLHSWIECVQSPQQDFQKYHFELRWQTHLRIFGLKGDQILVQRSEEMVKYQQENRL